MSTTIPEAARALRDAVKAYDEGHPATRKDGHLLPGARTEIAAADPVIEAATDLLEQLAGHGYVDLAPTTPTELEQ